MSFHVIRLGRDSVPNIQAIIGHTTSPATPLPISVTCTQVPADLKAGDFAFIWLGSDNDKGAAPAWRMGFRALAQVTKKTSTSYRLPATIDLGVGVIFSDSVDQLSFLDQTPLAYSNFAEMPVVGPRSRSAQTVLKIDDLEPRQNVSALLYSLSAILPAFTADVARVYPSIASLIGTAPAAVPGTGTAPVLLPAAPPQPPVLGADNKIIIGAPGTGKSRMVEVDPRFQEPESLIRTIFHPDYTYSDFIGSYQPFSPDPEHITYAFVPGPFTNALVRALNTDGQAFCLVIEEINRGNAAAIFGDIFQLLDRDDTGQSVFKVNPDPHLSRYLVDEVDGWLEDAKIYLPPNLWLMATMNSSDQGLQFMDSAFKRRWLFEYVPIDFDKCPWKQEIVQYAGKKYEWSSLGSAINDILQSLVPEDRLIGPTFLTKGDIADPNIVASKLLFYLWNDVLRHVGQEKLFAPQAQNKTFYGVMKAFLEGKEIFVPEVGKLLLGKEK